MVEARLDIVVCVTDFDRTVCSALDKINHIILQKHKWPLDDEGGINPCLSLLTSLPEAISIFEFIFNTIPFIMSLYMHIIESMSRRFISIFPITLINHAFKPKLRHTLLAYVWIRPGADIPTTQPAFGSYAVISVVFMERASGFTHLVLSLM